MQNHTPPEEKWVLYFSISGKTNPVACENTPEELMPKAGLGQPVKWTDQGSRYIGIPFDGNLPAEFYYTINQDGERLYQIQTGQLQPRRRKSALGEAFDAVTQWLGKVTR